MVILYEQNVSWIPPWGLQGIQAVVQTVEFLLLSFYWDLWLPTNNSKSTYIKLYGSGMDTALRSAVVQPEIVLPVHAASAIGQPTYDIAAYTKIVWPPWGTLTVLVQTKVQTEEFSL